MTKQTYRKTYKYGSDILNSLKIFHVQMLIVPTIHKITLKINSEFYLPLFEIQK